MRSAGISEPAFASALARSSTARCDASRIGISQAWYESEKTRRQLQVTDGELIPVADVERVVSTAVGAIAQRLQSIPDALERRHGVSGELAVVVEGALFEAMDDLADKLAELELPEKPKESSDDDECTDA